MQVRAYLIAVLLFAISTANAATVWNEVGDGDFTNFSGSTSTDVGLLGVGSNTFLGSLDGGPVIADDPPGAQAMNGPDEFDTFKFTTAGAWTLDFESLSGLTQLIIGYDDDDEGFGTNTNAFPVSIDTDVFGGPLAAGSYLLKLIPPGNAGAIEYELTINVSAVPIPAAVWLFGSGLLGLVGMAKRKKAA